MQTAASRSRHTPHAYPSRRRAYVATQPQRNSPSKHDSLTQKRRTKRHVPLRDFACYRRRGLPDAFHWAFFKRGVLKGMRWRCGLHTATAFHRISAAADKFSISSKAKNSGLCQTSGAKRAEHFAYAHAHSATVPVCRTRCCTAGAVGVWAWRVYFIIHCTIDQQLTCVSQTCHTTVVHECSASARRLCARCALRPTATGHLTNPRASLWLPKHCCRARVFFCVAACAAGLVGHVWRRHRREHVACD